MSLFDALEKRRSVYALTKELPISDEEAVALVKRVVELTPDAFNMKSAYALVVMGEKQNELWDAVYDAFGGKVACEKIDGFKAGAGTVLFYINQNTVKAMQADFTPYAANFPIWANQANGMLQSNIWAAFAEKGVGANLQHYNPVIDDKLAELFDVPQGYTLVAQMVFGGIAAVPDDKPADDGTRVKVVR
ncbi:nitroreductase family protein [Atopobium minutum]|uniref:nitroreductase family protein n=1 Tax=Atopobium minutum TaxID=1381 RepID=UPI00290C6357|nr:nitroreductase family protein [Atopobium minutum]MDU5129770.1 nitroreductase family protein [Atopobium minutum]